MMAAPRITVSTEGSGSMPSNDLDFHAGFLQVTDCAIQKSEAFHRTAAYTDDSFFAFEGFTKVLERALAVVQIPGKSKSGHWNNLLTLGAFSCRRSVRSVWKARAARRNTINRNSFDKKVSNCF